MPKENLHDLMLFVEIAREQSFTKAAAQLGLSQSALSHAMRNFEKRMGVRLLARTTRRVSTTEAGERLMQNVIPLIAEINQRLAEIRQMGNEISGTIRITATEHAAETIVWPKIRTLLGRYSDLKIEVSIDYGLTDIVRERFDAGVRIGEQIAKDMVAVRIGPDISMAVVATPAYFEKHGRPQQPSDLVNHNCINLRLPTKGGLYVWEFEKDGHEIRVRVNGQLVFNTMPQILMACRQGFGIAYVPEEVIMPEIESGRLVRILKGWCPFFSGYHLYYPNRRQHTAAFSLLVDTLRYRGA